LIAHTLRERLRNHCASHYAIAQSFGSPTFFSVLNGSESGLVCLFDCAKPIAHIAQNHDLPQLSKTCAMPGLVLRHCAKHPYLRGSLGPF
jgi:hypothetical protein